MEDHKRKVESEDETSSKRLKTISDEMKQMLEYAKEKQELIEMIMRSDIIIEQLKQELLNKNIKK
jgi:hypothetical protein